MQTMTKTLMALPLQDDALARRLLQQARGAFQKWPEEFAGFRAPIQCRTSGREASGWLQVSPGQRVDLHRPDAALHRLAQTMLVRLMDGGKVQLADRRTCTMSLAHSITPEHLLHDFGNRLRQLRKVRQLRQVDMEELGLSYKYYQRLESGQVNPTLLTLHKLASAFEVAVYDLFRTEPDPNPQAS